MPLPRVDWRLQVSPRDWQQRAFQAWLPAQRGVVQVVTGAGKTLLALMCMERFHHQTPNARTVILVPTIALMDQWFLALREDLAVKEELIGCYSGRERPSRPCMVNILVVNTARSVAPALSSGPPCLLIVDECHRLGTPVNSTALGGNYRAALGLSATPEREYDTGYDDYLRPILGDLIFTYEYRAALRDNVISPFNLVNIKVDLLPDEEEKYRDLTRAAAQELHRVEKGSGSPERLKRLLGLRAGVSSQASMRIPVAAKVIEQERGTRAIVFHERVASANLIARNLAARGHRATLYHSRIGPHTRRDNLRLYRHGIFDVLVTCRALDEGTNVPETRIAVIASSTASQRQRIQRLGRVLRPAPGKASATIFTIYATDAERQRLEKEAGTIEDISSVLWLNADAKGTG